MKGTSRLTAMERSCYRIYWRYRRRMATIKMGGDGKGDFSGHFAHTVFEWPRIDVGWCKRKRAIKAQKKFGLTNKFPSFGRLNKSHKRSATYGGYGAWPIRRMTIEELKAEYPNFEEDQNGAE